MLNLEGERVLSRTIALDPGRSGPSPEADPFMKWIRREESAGDVSSSVNGVAL